MERLLIWASVWVLLVGCGQTTAVLPTPAIIAEISPFSVPATSTPFLVATAVPAFPTSPSATPVTPQTAVPTSAPLPSPTPCRDDGRVETGSLPGQIAGSLAYRVYLPPCYGQDGRSYPTLYMLPGNIYNDAIWDTLGLDETAESLIHKGTIPPLLIVMVDGGWIANNTSGGPGSYESVIVEDVIPDIEARYCVWDERGGRAIGGMSRGGYWSLEIAFRHPDRFASVGGHSAALIDSYAGPDVNPQYTGLRNNLGDLRVYLDIGRRDPYIGNMRQLHEDMDFAGIPHTWVMNEGTHEEAYWMEHLADYLTWYAAPWPVERDSYPVCR